MGRVFPSRRRTFRETLEANQKAENFWADMSGKPRRENKILAELGPKRTRKDADPADSEGPVKHAVGDLLAAHPQVLLAVRQNSGAMQVQGADGRPIPIWFYKIVRKPQDMTFPDYWGFLTSGKPFALECKRPSWKKPSTDRELKQRAFIEMICALGGVGGFVRSADEALAVLP